MTEEFAPKTIKPTRGVPIRTIARVIAQTEWDTIGRNSGTWMRFTIYETRGGAYIAVTEGDVPGKPDLVDRTATVVEPIYKRGRLVTQIDEDEDGISTQYHGEEHGIRDETAMQIAVLDHFQWHDRAKRVLKNELGWAPYREVA